MARCVILSYTMEVLAWNACIDVNRRESESYLFRLQEAVLNFTVGFPTVSSPYNKSFDTEMFSVTLKAVVASCV